jgi:hypothetical protein
MIGEIVKKFVYVKILGALVLASLAAQAGPISVTYTVSGTSGDYTLDFTVSNNMTGFPSQDVYFFGVELSGRDIVGSPSADWNPNSWVSWNNTTFGGSSIVYNNNWIDFGYTGLLPGTSLSGFDVQISDAVAPTSVNWFAFAYSPDDADPYTGGGNFNSEENPGFEGVTGAVSPNASAPEPAAGTLLLTGLAAIGLWQRFRQRSAV